jgi:hypothetical protein
MAHLPFIAKFHAMLQDATAGSATMLVLQSTCKQNTHLLNRKNTRSHQTGK